MITPRDFWNGRSGTYDQSSGSQYAEAYDKTVANTLKYLKPEDNVLFLYSGGAGGLFAVDVDLG